MSDRPKAWATNRDRPFLLMRRDEQLSRSSVGGLDEPTNCDRPSRRFFPSVYAPYASLQN